ncbi:3-oxoacyl-[acyl-carrier-protein] synthase 2 [Anatilimnocola aggregata]|uniref:3-oxoacyl-[acyl-carrier-protein] synthase 2 n=1 Tax=Anatilimnocola aggregata TaxID=2528021 RepID=A0A517YLI6_9BACT|nr:beta-ketoacyl-[acyl-carrier-protein] synthase family protein [Anatilimnocola aggregata]QDU31095.1 3-oxoacyl-[acyl-carrier-protein] synthase 2 [Anatilimnocola aggregata]
MKREVVITGVGMVSPIGIGRDAFWTALDQGQSGIVTVPELAGATDVPYRLAGLFPNFDAKQYVQPRKTIKVMAREIQAAYAAAVIAMQDAALTKEQVDPFKLGVVLGSEILYGEIDELIDTYRQSTHDGVFHINEWTPHAMKSLFPLWMLKYLPNMAACHIGIVNDARGPNNTIVQGATSSLLAMQEAAAVIQRGHADVMVTGGSGAKIAFSGAPFRGWANLTHWQGPPTEAIKPFDRRRDGGLVGEGAGMFIFEAREHAERRGAKILAKVAGWSNRFEPPVDGRLTGSGIRASIATAIQSAGLSPQDVGHVNANAGGYLVDDRLEAQAIRAELGDVPVTAPKSFFGDLGASSGAVEAIASVLALQHGRIPRTLNYREPDPECPVNVVRDASLATDKPAALLLNHSDYGGAAAIVLTAG